MYNEIIECVKEKTDRIEQENRKQKGLEKINLELSEESENKIADHIIEQNSINPKFKEIVKNLKLTNPEEVLNFYKLTIEDIQKILNMVKFYMRSFHINYMIFRK